MNKLKNAKECYVAAMDALDAVKAIQCAVIRGDIKVWSEEIAWLEEARRALDNVATFLEGNTGPT